MLKVPVTFANAYDAMNVRPHEARDLRNRNEEKGLFEIAKREGTNNEAPDDSFNPVK